MPTEQIAIFNRQAKRYAKRANRKDIDYEWKKELLSAAKGSVLEVAVGAGSNFRFYPKNVKATAVDVSPAMLTFAKKAALQNNIDAFFINEDVEKLTFEPDSFDTIVSTFSLCAYKDPLTLLNNFNEWCRPDGTVLLLEHGLSKLSPVKWGQRIVNQLQYHVVGCHMNRDILSIVETSHLQLVDCKRRMLGMIYIVKAAPDKTRQKL